MGTLLHFTPKAELDSASNVQAFVELCKTSDIFRANSQFDRNTWEVDLQLEGKNGVSRLIFSTTEAAQAGKSEPCMEEPFLSFAKAVLVYLQSLRPTKAVSMRMAALRLMEAALRKSGKGSRPTALNPIVLDFAVELAREQFAPSTAYKTAGQLQAIVDLMREMTFIRLSVAWQSPLIRPRSNESRITPEAIAAREEMMPSSAALHAIGAIFNIAEGFTDVAISSMLALMLCAPERVNEVVRLEHTCLLDPEAGEFEGHTGIRWPGSKGAKDTIKWIPAAMSEVAKSAIFRIQASTQGARDIAKWYEDNPTKIYLHKDAEYLRGKAILNYAEVALILWGTKGRVESVGNWCKSPESLRPNRPGEVLFSEVERKVLGMLPTTFPYTSSSHGLKFSNALFVMRKDELHEKRAPYECMFDLLEQGDLANRLGQRDSSGIESIFTKYGFTEDDGTPIYVTSHQFRHYLNTLAQLGGLSQTEIAVFSGRKDVNQNTTYDHLSSTEVQQPISTAIQVHGFMSHLVEMPARSLIHRQEFLGLGVVAAHTTEYGYCVHNFASEPLY